MVEWQKFVEWLFYALISGVAFYGVSILSRLKESVDKLNATVATILEKTTWHEKEITRLEKRIDTLETKIP